MGRLRKDVIVGGFKGAGDSGPEGYDLVMGMFGGLNSLDGRLGNAEKFTMHLVVSEIISADW